MSARIAVSGGAGYIGSHVVTLLLEAGHKVLILDSFANAETDVPDRIAAIAGGPRAEVIRADVTAPETYADALSDFAPDAAIHFAGLKAVGEAMANPLEYYRVNVAGSVAFFQTLASAGCARLVFSSSATIYGAPDIQPIVENTPPAPENPYGTSKRMVEQIIEDWGRANASLAAVNLRYFNPVGAHPSARIGESPRGVPNNLMPFVADVAAGHRKTLQVFGDDWPTPDGTGVRDYIHVMDLARAHLAALDLTAQETGVEAINIGTGQGHSVMEMIAAFQAATGRDIPHVITKRRAGDVARLVADPTRAHDRLNWRAEHDLAQMCRDAWAWRRASNR